MHELPPRHGQVEVAGPEPCATEAMTWLAEAGREAILAGGWEFAPPGTPNGRLWKPNDFLAEVAALLSPGTALDLACGTGRDAVYLASLGWEITAVDHLPDAIDRGRDLARRYLGEAAARRITWLCQDLGAAPIAQTADLVSMFWFLDRHLIRSVPGLLNCGGSFVMETFTSIHRERFGKPRTESFVLKPGELAHLLPELEIQSCEEAWHGERHSARYWAKRPK